MIEQLTAHQVAEMLGIMPNTFHSYVARGQAPAPDGHLGRTPYWLATTIQDWLDAGRPSVRAQS